MVEIVEMVRTDNTESDYDRRKEEHKTWREKTVGRKLRGWYNKYGFSTQGINAKQLEGTVYCLGNDVGAAWPVYSVLLMCDCFSDDYVRGIDAPSSEDLALRLRNSANRIADCIHDSMRDNVDSTGFVKVSYQPKRELVELGASIHTKLYGETVQDSEKFKERLSVDLAKLNDITTRYAKMLAEVCATTDLTNLGQ